MIAINKVAVEPYVGKNKIEAKLTSGFATIKQKETMVGLKVVIDSKIQMGQETIIIKKGQTVYFSEEVLHAYDWSKKAFEIEGQPGRFVLADAAFVAIIGSL